ncbi:MAG: hypothetical protein UEY91_07825 [Lachnospiraceae bacterium]|nr:hypothetical protein [Lachnospiraceae bacterium]
MDDTQKMVVTLVTNLEQFSLDEYEQIKMILNAKAYGKPHLLDFLQQVYALVEEHHPKLICTTKEVA